MRANLKLHLMRAQAQEDEKRELQYSQSHKTSYVPSGGIDVPATSAPTQPADISVPAQVLQVRMSIFMTFACLQSLECFHVYLHF